MRPKKGNTRRRCDVRKRIYGKIYRKFRKRIVSLRRSDENDRMGRRAKFIRKEKANALSFNERFAGAEKNTGTIMQFEGDI